MRRSTAANATFRARSRPVSKAAPDPQLLAAAVAYRDDDPDARTRAEADGVLTRADPDELRGRFGSEIASGTAGLRGLIGAGTSRMNRRAVARTTAGLCAHLARTLPDAHVRGLCIGYDGRHESRAFAE